MQYSFFSDRYPKWTVWTILICVGLCALCSLLGWYVAEKPGDFFVNFFSGFAGIFFSFSIALLLIEPLVEHHRKRQWDKVRNITYKAIASHLCDMVQIMIIHFYQVKEGWDLMSLVTAGRERPNPDTATAMEKLAQCLRELPGEVSAEKTISDVAVEFYEEVQWDLDQIRDVLTVRVIQSSGDQQAINALVEFDGARRKLHNAIIVEKQLSINQVFPDVITLLEQAQVLYSVLCERWGDGRTLTNDPVN